MFARAPRLGAVKRRLARDIGARAALRFYRATLIRLLRALAADRRFRTVLAVTPDRARLAAAGCRACPRRRRSRRAHGSRLPALPHRRVALIGCDIPDAGPADCAAAFRALGAATRLRPGRRTAATGWWRCHRAGRRVRSPRCAGRASTRWRTRWPISRGRRVALLRTTARRRYRRRLARRRMQRLTDDAGRAARIRAARLRRLRRLPLAFTATMAAAAGVLGRRRARRRRRDRLRQPGQCGGGARRSADGRPSVAGTAAAAGRVRLLGAADAARLSRRPGQRHPAGDRGAATSPDDGVGARARPLRIAVGKIAADVARARWAAPRSAAKGRPCRSARRSCSALGRLLPRSHAPSSARWCSRAAAAGIAAAFNTPLAGIVFAIEELSRSFEARASGMVLTAVIIAGIVALGAQRQLHLFRRRLGAAATRRRLASRCSSAACVGGIAGGLFSCAADPVPAAAAGGPLGWLARAAGRVRRLLRAGRRADRRASRRRHLRHRLSAGARRRRGHAPHGRSFFAAQVRCRHRLVSQRDSGRHLRAVARRSAPGSASDSRGCSRSAGAAWCARHGGYFAGVAQAPITSFVIVMEMTDDQQ